MSSSFDSESKAAAAGNLIQQHSDSSSVTGHGTGSQKFTGSDIYQENMGSVVGPTSSDENQQKMVLSPGRGAIDKNFRVKYFSAIRTGYDHLSNEKEFLAIPKNYIESAPFL